MVEQECGLDMVREDGLEKGGLNVEGNAHNSPDGVPTVHERKKRYNNYNTS